jgi:hypothetical protein
MTAVLWDALKRLRATRGGLVIRNLSGEAKNDENQLKNLSYRICRLAGLPERGWHTWRLMTWMGHKRIDETMRYVQVADGHRRDLPPELVAVVGETDPDRRILKLLGARKAVNPRHSDGTKAATQTEKCIQLVA